MIEEGSAEQVSPPGSAEPTAEFCYKNQMANWLSVTACRQHSSTFSARLAF